MHMMTRIRDFAKRTASQVHHRWHHWRSPVILYNIDNIVQYFIHRRSSGKVKRLIILHAGTENGWVPNDELVFESKVIIMMR